MRINGTKNASKINTAPAMPNGTERLAIRANPVTRKSALKAAGLVFNVCSSIVRPLYGMRM
jgi:hypothetical protein